jgi:hypothetical protein
MNGLTVYNTVRQSDYSHTKNRKHIKMENRFAFSLAFVMPVNDGSRGEMRE